MGSCQLKPILASEKISNFSVANNTKWLNDLIMALASEAIAPQYTEDIQMRLQGVPLSSILLSIGLTKSNLNNSVKIVIYKNWLDANNSTSSLLYAAWFNIGVLFERTNDYVNAAIAYDNALTLRPDMHAAAINLGLLFETTSQPDQALAVWERALQSDEMRITVQIQQGRLLEKLEHFEDAEKILCQVLMANSLQPDVLHHWVHIRQKICHWPIATSNIPGISAEQLIRSSGPLGILALTDDISFQHAAAAAWIARKTELAPHRLAPTKPYLHDRIRIGYISSDFCNHAMSYLITELFECHDRQRFKIFGYCSSQDDGSLLRRRIIYAFDCFRTILTLSDEQAAKIICDDEIDILIELNGITDGSRLAVLRWKPAPIQATYLGFIGPVPLPELDYILCDNIVIPIEYKDYYQPKPLPIAQIYQANDSKRTMGPQISRLEVGLPEDCFIFCCFSKHYKITEEVFAAWMSILRRTNRTVLWLTMDNIYSQQNMLAKAEHANISQNRLIFSERTDPDLYLSRLELANLFLDTFPYNAGTVASDSIRMRLPIITLRGKSFASRMATSLLQTVGASQGITSNLPEYIDTAVRLANDPIEYARYKALFTDQIWNQTIGNISRFTKEFENTWYQLVINAHDT